MGRRRSAERGIVSNRRGSGEGGTGRDGERSEEGERGSGQGGKSRD